MAPWDLETSLAPSLGGLGLTNPDSSVRAQKRSKARLEKQRKAPRRRWPRVFMDGVWAGGGMAWKHSWEKDYHGQRQGSRREPARVWVWLEPSRGHVDRKRGGMRKETPVGI